MAEREEAQSTARPADNGLPNDLWPVPEPFYRADTVSVARALLGVYLVHDGAGGLTAGKIVETEAYLGRNDPASHAFPGPTPRNQAMFGDPGHAYIYFIYGMYYCVNVVTMPAGTGEAVLLRALEPVAGIALMTARRRGARLERLCDGPAKLVLAMGITPALSGHDFRRPPLMLMSRPGVPTAEVVTSRRIGISKAADRELRFSLAGNPFVSRS
jgi:DNA-3-methyladenine glycosylase